MKAAQIGRQLRDRGRNVHHRQSETVIGGVGDVAGQHFVEQHPEAVKIGAGIDFLAANLFWTHIARSAQRQAGAGHDGAGAESFGDAKVGQHRRAVFPEQDILRFDVAVDDAASVGVMQGIGNRPSDVQSFGQRQTGADALLQGIARQVLHRQIVGLLIGGDVIDGDDVRIAELGNDPAFAKKTLSEFLIGGEDRLDDFQGDMAVQRLLHGEVNYRHAALAEFALDLIAWNLHI